MTSRPWNGRFNVTWPILNFSHPIISLERLKLETTNLVCMLIIASPSLPACSLSRDLLNFWKIIYNNSIMVQDSLIVLMKFEYEAVCALSNCYVAVDLGWPLTTLNHFNFAFCVACNFVIGDRKNFTNLMYRLNVQVTAYRR